MRHDIIIDGAIVESVNPWRPDCAQNPVSPQYGTWEYPRNGWCPGGVALGHTLDITPYVTPGATTSVDPIFACTMAASMTTRARWTSCPTPTSH